MSDSQGERQCQIVLLGEAGTGKTCLLQRLIGEEFSPATPPTVGFAARWHQFVVDGETVNVQVIDTAGQERHHSVSKCMYRNAPIALFVYAINCRDSFHNVRRWIEMVRAESNENPVCLLIGNKADLEEERDISQAEGESLAGTEGMWFFETSALSGVGVQEAFVRSVQMWVRKGNNAVRSEVGFQVEQTKSKCCD